MPASTINFRHQRTELSLPPILRRSYRLTSVLAYLPLYWIAAIGACELLLPPAVRPLRNIGGSGAGIILLLSAPFVLFVAYWIWMLRFGARARVRRGLIEARFCICGHCGHALRGLATLGRCPECGTTYDARRLRSYWRRWARPPRRGHPGLHYGRSYPWPARIFAIAAALFAIVGFGIFSNWRSWLMPMLIPILGWIAMMLWDHEHLGVIKRRAALAEDLDRTDGRLCARCGWPLIDDAQTGRCRACRKPYDLLELRAHWRRERPPHWRIEIADKPG